MIASKCGTTNYNYGYSRSGGVVQVKSQLNAQGQRVAVGKPVFVPPPPPVKASENAKATASNASSSREARDTTNCNQPFGLSAFCKMGAALSDTWGITAAKDIVTDTSDALIHPARTLEEGDRAGPVPPDAGV